MSCGNYGQRLTMKELYAYYTVDNSEPYTFWDGNHLSACMCDYGHTGNKCEMSKYHKIMNLGYNALQIDNPIFTLCITIFHCLSTFLLLFMYM